MIISQIIGGLGNQMFQYAAGRALSLARGQPLRLDISEFSGYSLHQGFELQRIFNCPASLAAESDLRHILGWQASSRVRRMVSRPGLSKIRSKKFIIEPHFHYWSKIGNVPEDCYLAGYWQSEKYFRAHAVALRLDFQFSQQLAGMNLDLADKISQVDSVSLHVRRGDYANNATVNAVHGLCSLDYYRDAIGFISDRVSNPFFFVFSDDINWVSENLKIGFPCQYVNCNHGAESYNDMRLMALSRNNIIANSSFSWWGAWLNSNPDKIVVAPRKWFSNETNVADLIPRDWVVL